MWDEVPLLLLLNFHGGMECLFQKWGGGCGPKRKAQRLFCASVCDGSSAKRCHNWMALISAGLKPAGGVLHDWAHTLREICIHILTHIRLFSARKISTIYFSGLWGGARERRAICLHNWAEGKNKRKQDEKQMEGKSSVIVSLWPLTANKILIESPQLLPVKAPKHSSFKIIGETVRSQLSWPSISLYKTVMMYNTLFNLKIVLGKLEVLFFLFQGNVKPRFNLRW